jgi:hypothetical protein
VEVELVQHDKKRKKKGKGANVRDEEEERGKVGEKKGLGMEE